MTEKRNHSVIANGDNDIGRALAKRLVSLKHKVTVTTRRKVKKTEILHPLLTFYEVDLWKQNIVDTPYSFLQKPLQSFFYICTDSDRTVSTKRNIGAETWPWIGILQNIKKRGMPYPHHLVIIIASDDPTVAALNQAEMNYITADTINEPLHINTVHTNSYDNGDRSEKNCLITSNQVADAAFIFTSGLLDAMKAQTIHLR